MLSQIICSKNSAYLSWLDEKKKFRSFANLGRSTGHLKTKINFPKPEINLSRQHLSMPHPCSPSLLTKFRNSSSFVKKFLIALCIPHYGFTRVFPIDSAAHRIHDCAHYPKFTRATRLSRSVVIAEMRLSPMRYASTLLLQYTRGIDLHPPDSRRTNTTRNQNVLLQVRYNLQSILPNISRLSLSLLYTRLY